MYMIKRIVNMILPVDDTELDTLLFLGILAVISYKIAVLING